MSPFDSAPCNIAASLPRAAREHPERIALRCPGRNGRYDSALSYAQLDARSDAIAAGLARRGIVRGTRTVVMLRPTPEFFLVMFALFKAGAVPVLVDPGIDRRALRQCLDEAQPQAFIGIPLAHLARTLLGWARSARMRISTGARAWLADATLAQVERDGAKAGPQLADTQPDDIAAILFTSGSTGVPKGVLYRHRHFVAQIEMLRAAFGIEPGGVDLPTFPPFALFDPALGLTSIIPDMDPTRPAKADPRRLLQAIERFGVTQLFGSPALVAVLARHGVHLPTIKRVLSAGAPVPADVVERMRALLPDDAQLFTPYGATECLPVAVIEGRELQATREATERGAGTCVGRAGGAERGAHHPRRRRPDRATGRTPCRWRPGTSARSPSPDRAPPTRTSSATRPRAWPRSRSAAPTAANASCIAWATWAGSTPTAGCGSAAACRSAWSAPTRPCAPSRSSRCSTPMPTCGARRWSASARAARSAPVLCVELRDGVDKAQHPRILEQLRHLADGQVHTAKVEAFLFHPGSRSISATTPRSAARRSRRGPRTQLGRRA